MGTRPTLHFPIQNRAPSKLNLHQNVNLQSWLKKLLGGYIWVGRLGLQAWRLLLLRTSGTTETLLLYLGPSVGKRLAAPVSSFN